MKLLKRVPMILLMVLPNIAIITFLICIYAVDNSEAVFINTMKIYIAMICIIYIPNIIYAIILTVKGIPSQTILFWNMIIKIFHILFHLLVFIIEFMFVITIIGLGALPILFIMDSLLLFTSSAYGICGIVRAVKDNRFTKNMGILFIIMHLFFVIDLVSAVICFIIANSKKSDDIDSNVIIV